MPTRPSAFAPSGAPRAPDSFRPMLRPTRPDWRVLATDVVAAGFGVGAVLAVLDLWHVALQHPATLSLRDVASLTALYVLLTMVAAVAIIVPLHLVGVRSVRAVATIRAAMLAAGGWLLAVELALQVLSPNSALRPWAAPLLLVAAVASVGMVASLVRDIERQLPLAGALGLLAVVGALGALGATAPPRRAQQSPPPATSTNVVLVTIDSLRADHLGAYGYGRPTSPRLDALAAEGVSFERVRAQAASPTPSTASLLTGTFPSRHGGFRDRSTVASEALSLAEVLKQAGLETAAFSANPWITPEFGFGQGFDHFFAVPRERIVRFPLLLLAIRRVNRLFDPQANLYGRLRRRIVGDVPTWERDQQVTAAALGWIEANREKPFFAYLHYMSLQQPYRAPGPRGSRFVPKGVRDPAMPPPTSLLFSQAAAPLGDDAYDEVIGSYDSSILFVDHLVGRLVRGLRALGVLDDTIVVVTSDQGQEFYEHRNWGHGHSLYDEVLHVPLVIRHPSLPADRRVVSPAMLVDVFPTILELAGLPAPGGLDGTSLVPRVLDDTGPGGPDGYAEHLGSISEARTVVDDGWKLIVVREGGRQWSELYDMRADRGEERDLLADAATASPGVTLEAQRLRGVMRATRGRGPRR